MWIRSLSFLSVTLSAVATVAACSSSSSGETLSSCSCDFSYNGDKRTVQCGQATCYGMSEWSCTSGSPAKVTAGAASCKGTTPATCACTLTTGGATGAVVCGARKCVGTSEVSCSDSKEASVSENAASCKSALACSCMTTVGGASKTLSCGESYCLSGTTKYSCPESGGTPTQTASDPACTPPDYTSRFMVDGVAVTCTKTKQFHTSGALTLIAESCTGAGVDHIWVEQKQPAPRGAVTTNTCALGSDPSRVEYDTVTLFPNADTSGAMRSGTRSGDACSVKWTSTLSSSDIRIEVLGAAVRTSGTATAVKQVSGGGLAQYIVGL